MTAAIVFALSVDKAVPAPADSAPPAVLSRQLPRLAVHLLNGGEDRGLRFFPLIGREDSERRFFVIDELLAVQTLMTLHGQPDAPQFLVDGCILERALHLRIHDGVTGALRFDEEIPFDPGDPLPAVTRMMFELTGVLEWPGAPPAVPGLSGEALAHYLVARDNLLSLEAGLIAAGTPRPAESVVDALTRAPEEPEVQRLLIEICTRLLASGTIEAARVAQTLEHACTLVDHVGADRGRVLEFLGGVAGVLESCGQTESALGRYERIVALEPTRVDAASRTATLHFEAGRFEAAKHSLHRVLDAGWRDATVLAQLAIVEQQLGNTEGYEQLLEEMVQRRDLQPPMVRLAVSYLIERERGDEALALADEYTTRDANPAGPWFDKGRALVAIGRAEDALEAFARCRAREPGEALEREIDRYVRFARTPELLTTLRDLDVAVRGEDLKPALRRARELARRYPDTPEAWLLLGVAQQRLQHLTRAERAFRKALELQSDLGEAHNRLGILLVERRRFSEGHEHLSEAIRLLPEEPSAQIHFAQACRFLGLRDEGLAALDRAQSLGAAEDTITAVRETFE